MSIAVQPVIDPAELVNLDVTIAEFILPRLRAFKDATDSFPADLDDMGEWHAELDEMIAAFTAIVEYDGPAYYVPFQAGIDLFAKRLGHLWR